MAIPADLPGSFRAPKPIEREILSFRQRCKATALPSSGALYQGTTEGYLLVTGIPYQQEPIRPGSLASS